MRAVEEVVNALNKFGIESIIQLETRDPQYAAVCGVVRRHGEEVGARLAMLNALVSYRLLGRGEEHWKYFSQHFQQEVEDVCKSFLTYLETSPYLRLGVENKKRRILKTCNYIPDLENLKNTLLTLSKLLQSEPDQKTLVFTLKILNYAYSCSRGAVRLLPMDVPIPVDFRVASLSWCAGLVDMAPREAMRRYREVQAVWNEIAQLTGIPPLHIDTVLWLAGRAVLYGENIHGLPHYLLRVFERRGGCKRLLKLR
ncbi:MAG: N-glycosylase/DNA lyase [Pyrobaculum sp.]